MLLRELDVHDRLSLRPKIRAKIKDCGPPVMGWLYCKVLSTEPVAGEVWTTVEIWERWEEQLYKVGRDNLVEGTFEIGPEHDLNLVANY